uniref:Waprin-Phi3-like protein transcript variant X2 n=1 Tax=Micrurus mipartitus TaxID=430902 RepID=A0AAU6NT00_MICMP
MKPWILLLLAGLLVLSPEWTSAKTKGQCRYQIVKPGECPMFKIDPNRPCNQDCACDSNCKGNKKCCPIGCARECFTPGLP